MTEQKDGDGMYWFTLDSPPPKEYNAIFELYVDPETGNTRMRIVGTMPSEHREGDK